VKTPLGQVAHFIVFGVFCRLWHDLSVMYTGCIPDLYRMYMESPCYVWSCLIFYAREMNGKYPYLAQVDKDHLPG
jgi:hypothetical protein